jgi:hypothetical protein
VEKEFETCDHKIQLLCSENQNAICDKKCDFILNCGHKCSGDCGQCQINGNHILCTIKCNKDLFCGHRCKSNCHNNENH